MALDDSDLAQLVSERKQSLGPQEYCLLRQRFENLIL